MRINWEYKALIYNNTWHYPSDIMKWIKWKLFWTKIHWHRKLGIVYEYPYDMPKPTNKDVIRALYKYYTKRLAHG